MRLDCGIHFDAPTEVRRDEICTYQKDNDVSRFEYRLNRLSPISSGVDLLVRPDR
jgi:hypothetical protein